MENNEIKKKFVLKVVRVIISITINLEDFDLDNISIDQKLNDSILIYDIWYKTLIGFKSLRNRFDKTDGFIRIYYN